MQPTDQLPNQVPNRKTQLEAAYARHADRVYRLCFTYLKNPADTEDAVQETFLRLFTKAPAFAGQAHEKAWLLVTAGNLCKDKLRQKRRSDLPVEDYAEVLPAPAPVDSLPEVLAAVLALPVRLKTPVYLYYYEGYSGEEIANMLSQPASTVRNHLREARQLLRQRLGRDDFD